MNQQARKLIESGDAAGVERYFRERPQLLQEVQEGPWAGQTWLHFAAHHSTPEVVRRLFGLGLPLNTLDGGGDCPLAAILQKGDVETARWMVEQGADPTVSAWPMFQAISLGSLELVRRFVELGARTDYDMGFPPQSLAEHAEERGHREIAAYLRSLPRRQPGEWDGEAEICEYFRKHTGRTPKNLRLPNSFSDPMNVAVWLVEPADRKAPKLLFTTGMSDRPLIIPEDDGIYQYVELVMRVPANWKTEPERVNSDVSWTWDWLRKIALLMHQYESYIPSGGAVVSKGNPPELLDPSTPFCAFLLLPEHGDYPGFGMQNGRIINIVTAVPIYQEEFELARQKGGIEQLLARFRERGIETAFLPGRPNAALEAEPPRKPGFLGRFFRSS